MSAAKAEARWFVAGLERASQSVAAFVPQEFAAYARVFHPLGRTLGDGSRVPVRWRDVSASHELTIEEELFNLDLAGLPVEDGSHARVWDHAPFVGSVPLAIANTLVEVLAMHTAREARCWFAVWQGWGNLAAIRPQPFPFAIPHRDMLLVPGVLADALVSFADDSWGYRSPNLWWPADHHWCVATEIDFHWTYVGGSTTLIHELARLPSLEAYVVDVNEPF